MIEILSRCPDFQDELTKLRWVASQLGVIVERTPKCHPELAGEGIEYAWGFAKAYYRSVPMEHKKKYDEFKETVRKCVSRELLTIDRIRSFSRRARRYIVTYFVLHQKRSRENEQNTSENSNVPYSFPLEDIEKLVRKFKTHRSVFDTHNSVLVNLVKEAKNGD